MANHGGARVGSGRKRRNAGLIGVVGGRVEDSNVSLIAPEDMPTQQREVWQEWAGKAIETRTLSSQTVPGFTLLCEQEAERRQIQALVFEQGRTIAKYLTDSSGSEHGPEGPPLPYNAAKLEPRLLHWPSRSHRPRLVDSQQGLNAPFSRRLSRNFS